MEDFIRKENANRLVGSYGWRKCTIAEQKMKEIALKEMYPPEIAKSHMQGFIHIHDLTNPDIGYCTSWSILDILTMGFRSPNYMVSSRPPKHLSSCLMQIVNFLGVVQQEWSGAQAINSIDTLLAPFVYYDKLDYRKVKQCIQEFIFNLNITYRWGNEPVFSNISLDLTVPEDLENTPVIIGGEVKDRCYGDFQEEMDMINRAILEVFLEGDGNGRPFTFPIPTYGITRDFEWDGIGTLLARVTSKYGTPYFQNYISSGLSPGDVRAMCCRLQLHTKELRRKVGGLFGYNDKTGSIGVCTINLPKIAYLSKDESEFFELLEYYMNIAKQSLEIKRKVIQKNLENNVMPYTRIYLTPKVDGKELLDQTFKNHFSTIGIVGGNEACLNLLECTIVDKEGLRFMERVLDFMREKILEFQEETGNLYNLEATPAESAAYRLAKIDKLQYKDIITAGTRETPYYTNSVHIPVYLDVPLHKAIRHQEKLQTKFNGGTVFHVFLPESPEVYATKLLIKRICERSKLPYISITPTFSICKNHGYLRGKHWTCPYCGEECLVYSRITGYYRPVQNWNEGKVREFFDRREYVIAGGVVS